MIVIVGILSTIVIVAYNGVQQTARNVARIQSVDAIQKNMFLYQAEFGKSSLSEMISGGAGEGWCLGTDYQDVAPGVDYSCRYVVPSSGSPYATPVNQAIYDALRSVSQYSMNYTPVTQLNFSGINSITSSAPFITKVQYSLTGQRYTIDNGPLRDYYVLLSYRLEGIDQDCKIPVVRIASETATQRNFTSNYKYSVTNGGATECWLWLEW